MAQDHAKALRWFLLAAEQGSTAAMFSLGVNYRGGDGVPQDDVQAYMWFNLLAGRTNGFERDDGIRNLDLLAPQMTPEQIAEAERLAREWDAVHPREPE